MNERLGPHRFTDAAEAVKIYSATGGHFLVVCK